VNFGGAVVYAGITQNIGTSAASAEINSEVANSGFNVSCPWREVAVSTVSFSLLYPVLTFSVVLFEYSFVYVSLHSA